MVIPLIISFPKFDKSYKMVRPDQSYPTIAMWIKVCSDLWFTVDMVLNFRTGIIDGDDYDVILNVKRIRQKYFGFWFWIDLVSTVPLDLLIEIIHLYSDQGQSRSMFIKSCFCSEKSDFWSKIVDRKVSSNSE